MTTKSDYIQFTKEMKKDYTILIPTMLPVHFRFLTKIFRENGYHAEFLEETNPRIREAGLKYVHNDTCYPALLIIGQFIDALNSGKYDLNKVALLITQTGGGCRASNYIYLIRKALKKAGYGHVPVISLSLGLEDHPGFKVTLGMALKMVYCVFYGDLLMLLSNQCRPYERREGETTALVERWVDRILDELNNPKNMRYAHVKDNFREMCRNFSAILDGRPRDKVKVGIVGEIYIKFSPLGNNNLEKFLVQEGAETIMPGFMDFCLFLLNNGVNDYKLYGVKHKKALFSKFAYNFVKKKQDDLRMLLKNEFPEFMPPADFAMTRRQINGYISEGTKMGEGWLLTAEMLELIGEGINNIVCVQPFGCLPNHISGKGMMKLIKEKNPGVNLVAIDYDPSATEINQENRLKLMLSNAR